MDIIIIFIDILFDSRDYKKHAYNRIRHQKSSGVHSSISNRNIPFTKKPINMKYAIAIVLAALFAGVLAAPLSDSADAQIEKLESDVGPDQYKFM